MTGNAPLDGVSVVELSVHRAGPFCGALLADLGADVVKVERPDGSLLGSIPVSGPTQRMKGERFEEEPPNLLLGTVNEVELNIAYLTP